MFDFLTALFSPHKKKKRRHAAILPASENRNTSQKPSESSDSSGQFEIEAVTAVPFWFLENSSFEHVTYSYPKENLKVPQFSTEVRMTLQKYLQDICPKPDGSMMIYQKLNDPDATVKEISALVSSDPLLAAQILRQVNSAAYGLTSEVTSIGRAVTLLGFQNVRSVVLGHAVRKGITSGVQDEKSIQIREHSLMSSAIAFHLSENISGIDQFTVSTITLLHDMGKVLAPLLKEKGRGINLSVEVPTQVLEALITSTFTEIWSLPKSISEVLTYIYHPYFYPIESVPQEHQKICTTVAISSFLANVMNFKDGDEFFGIQEEYLNAIHFDNSPNRWISESLAAKIEHTRAIYK